jgi:hypothetical protein
MPPALYYHGLALRGKTVAVALRPLRPVYADLSPRHPASSNSFNFSNYRRPQMRLLGLALHAEYQHGWA